MPAPDVAMAPSLATPAHLSSSLGTVQRPAVGATGTTRRLDAWLSALLLLAGSTLFIGAGRLHPKVNASIGALGTEEFYRSFAEHMLHTPDWQGMHMLILLGPVLWALAAAGAARVLPADARPLGELGRNALLLAAVLWVIAFVLDGYLGPRYAEAMLSAPPGAVEAAMREFSMNQYLMARLGLISVALLGLGVLSFGAALLLGMRRHLWCAIVGALGLVVGAWPLLAAVRGEFAPGPFTSVYWMPTALSFGVWFMLLGGAVWLCGRGAAPDDTSARAGA